MSDFPVTEVFRSFQGEGNAAGRLALFLRFHFCNLTCSWCDSKYTWHGKSGPFSRLSVEELRSRIRTEGVGDVILTGGEPTLHALDRIPDAALDVRFHVECNGSLPIHEDLDVTLADGTRLHRPALDLGVVKHWNWVISPKSVNAKQTPREDVLAWWAGRPFAIFKWIVRADRAEDLDEVARFSERHGVDPRRIWIGLEGRDRESQLGNAARACVEEILRRGWNHSPRLHVLLWGDERGR